MYIRYNTYSLMYVIHCYIQYEHGYGEAMGHFTLVVYDPPELPHRVVVDAPCKFLQRQIPCLAACFFKNISG